MQAIKCEMCNSNDFVKEDGYFVCQHCGTKYTVEEAKKLMVEGTVKIDNSDFVKRYLENARRAKAKEDWEETEKYYNLVEQNEPSNIEAIFYSAYGKAKSSLVDSDIYKRQAAFKVLQNCVSILDDNFDIEKEAEQKEIIKQICGDIISMSGSSFVYNKKVDGYGTTTWDDSNQTYGLFALLNVEICTTLEEIIKKYPADRAKDTIFYYQLAILHRTLLMNMKQLTKDSRQVHIDRCQKYHEEWHKIDPSHEIPEPQSTGGCYVATAVYGSYDCPEVWTLRRYRDNTLAETWYGRAFVRTYYAISPTLVRWFGETKWFKKMWQGKLDRMVKRLKDEGVEDTPYEDKKW